MTTNAIGLHIAKKNVTKTMERNQAVKLWNDLRSEGFTRNGCKLGDVEGEFTFLTNGDKVSVSYEPMGVPS